MDSVLINLMGVYAFAAAVAIIALFRRMHRLEKAERMRVRRKREREEEQQLIGDKILREMRCLHAANTAMTKEIRNVIYKGDADKMTEAEFSEALKKKKECDDDE